MNELINLIPATETDYPIIYNLARFYAYDISEFYGDEPGWEIGEDGLYDVGVEFKKYFSNKNAFSFLVRYRGNLAGFAIVDKEGIDPTADFNMAQFFILRTYKRKKIGKYIAFECFKKFRGSWEVHVLPKNEIAYRFWKSIITEYTHNNIEEKILKNKKNEDRITFRFSTDQNTE